ncbi:putative sulfate exporter family transporter [Zhaonella formicivorans]|uniref:putative sulfate exporter family transporter n=1 Tax=Zhaonella formicivorans TaxID=2528593 RepID=UPI001D11A573|nr:putative sulfate exporter family transporter [Zhaonella formicivorans]
MPDALIIIFAIILFWWLGHHLSLTRLQLPIPWFVFGFLGFSLVNTFNFMAPAIEQSILQISILVLTMARLGLNVELQLFRQVGGPPCLWSSALALFGWLLLALFQIT